MINITVTGDNPAEVLAQLRALVLSPVETQAIANEASHRADDAAREKLQAERDAQNQTVGTEAAKRVRKAKGNDAPTAETTTDTTPAASEEATNAGTSTSDAPAAAVNLDFDTDVAPKVLAAVQKAGKPAVTELLAQFGVERASQLEADRWPELVNMLADLA